MSSDLSRISACPREEGFHVLAGNERLCLRFAFPQKFAGDEIADLALADFEVSGGFLGRVGRLLRDESFCFHLRDRKSVV